MGPKRTSSICYISPSSPVVSSFLRSPPPSVIREANETSSVDHSRSLPLRRTASLPRHSITHHTSPGNSNLIVEAQTPPPMTLVEKHADLLSFIAQKESKCLELRGQLATHEAELATLKRKWERIVKRSTASKSAGLAPTAGEVVGVIRDGVQGLGRMLVMGGLGSSTMSPTSNSSSMAKSHVETVVGTTGSRSSSLSSIAVTSSTATDRSSVSSVTSLSPSDSEGEPPIPRKNVTEVGGLTPTSAQFPIDESASNNTKDILEPVVSEVTSTARPPSLLFNTLFADSKDPRTSSPARDLGERVTEKTLTSLSSASSPWSGINKKWEEIQKTDSLSHPREHLCCSAT
ncbi:uncharacterized protein EI90DRAFT_2020748 [Cantharellus anzutake]|uniref:uncharacterized protein n=1 Tax=Cantharellus anzutake TaxID=1750568 RepID=UPI001908F910|nr:uncharacterized protein EI90DRAFT_2020748 [Cantharellus anzutake]KAF8325822.1 hypothetical protein EI90DRAFT_2020748 [Cantharellus anzutake]